jgi:hypothetical protein
MAYFGALVARYKAWVLSVAAVMSTLGGIYLMGRRSGAESTKVEHERTQAKAVRRIEDAADSARKSAIASPVDRLRKSGRIRPD